mmetsp:Transcript_6309/g.14494  ORF Transcript_6309/g.14494 Transcript_6309/m.14494 type:complete len:217 (-) Transcript_6309:1114-1764(-)
MLVEGTKASLARSILGGKRLRHQLSIQDPVRLLHALPLLHHYDALSPILPLRLNRHRTRSSRHVAEAVEVLHRHGNPTQPGQREELGVQRRGQVARGAIALPCQVLEPLDRLAGAVDVNAAVDLKDSEAPRLPVILIDDHGEPRRHGRMLRVPGLALLCRALSLLLLLVLVLGFLLPLLLLLSRDLLPSFADFLHDNFHGHLGMILANLLSSMVAP